MLRSCAVDRVFAVVRVLLLLARMVAGARNPIALPFFVGALALGGCAYQPDSFSYVRQPFNGVFVSVDCLDLAIAKRKNSTEGNVLEYQFGNRCDEPAVVDLAFARVYGTTTDGSSMDLYAFDPFHELKALRLDARSVGREAIDYPSQGTIDHVCIDAASIAHTYPPRWVCFNSKD
jgi:hypothetical protein